MKRYLLSALLLTLVSAAPAAAGGPVNVQGTFTSVLFNGPSTQKSDIVFVGDGFQSGEQASFNTKVNDAVAALAARPGYAERMCGFNIFRVNVVSADSGVDHPDDAIFKNTELNVRYGNSAAGEAERCIRSDTPERCFEAAGHAPAFDIVFVLANDTQYGGCATSGLTFSSIGGGFAGLITHELGHRFGSLADEYDYFLGPGIDSGQSYVGPEPGAVNLTIATTLGTIKWNDLIAPGTPIPTTMNVPPGVVGLWEGGGYKTFDIYRPQSTCHMRTLGSEFCAVCRRELNELLESRCDPCEINPLSFACLWSKIGPIVAIDPRYKIHKWPWPGCLTCPPDPFLIDDFRLQVIGELPDAGIIILDEHGKTIAQSAPTRNGHVVEWEQSRARNFDVQLTIGGKLDRTARVPLKAFRNGKQFQMK